MVKGVVVSHKLMQHAYHVNSLCRVVEEFAVRRTNRLART